MSSRFVRSTHTQMWGWSVILLSTLFLSPVAAAAVHRALADSAIVLPLPEGTLPTRLGERNAGYVVASGQDIDEEFDATTDMVVAILTTRRVALLPFFTSFDAAPTPTNYCLLPEREARASSPPRAPPV
jgi:hypothetical protein